MTRFYDNTKLSSFGGCPRRYLLRHHEGWNVSGGMPAAPGYGICWHAAMDAVWNPEYKDLPDMGLVKKGFQSFMASWEEMELPDQTDVTSGEWKRMADRGRVPDNAAEMLLNYVSKRRSFLRQHEVLSIEQPFVVPLHSDVDDVMYCGRLDKVIRKKNGKVWIVDHKTSSSYSKTSDFQESFTETFSPDSQIDGYLYAGHMLFGENFEGVWIDAALVWKTRADVFGLIPVRRDFDHLDAWLMETRQKIESIESHVAVLDEYLYQHPEKEDMPTWLPSFPKNAPMACYEWNNPCMFHDICKVHSNPLKIERPDYFIIDKWSPFEHNNLAQLGYKEDEPDE